MIRVAKNKARYYEILFNIDKIFLIIINFHILKYLI